MKRLASVLLYLVLIFCPAAADAQIVGALPFNLQNNTTADATQVMANFNTIVNGVNAAAAHKGVNSDITQLSALTTPLSPSQGGTNVWLGGTSTGSANAQVVSTLNPASGFSLTTGYKVRFIAGFSNTGPMTLNVFSTGVKNVVRYISLTGYATAGSEITAASVVEVAYDGTNWELLTNNAPGAPGEVREFAGPCSAGWQPMDGSAISRTTFTALFSQIGTSYGPGDGSTTFNVPDARGRYLVQVDSGAGRADSCGTGVLSNTCGSRSIAQANLPAVAPTITITDPGHMHVQNASTLTSTGGNNGQAGGDFQRSASVLNTAGATTGITATSSNLGSGTAYYPNTLVLNRCIKL